MIKLLPDQISKFWDLIKYALEDSPPLTIGNINSSWINNLLVAALSGEIEVWISYEKEEKIKLNGIVLTSFEIDKFVKEKSLLIYYLYTYGNTGIRPWIKGLKALAKYARSRNCSRIISYSKIPEILKVSKELGGDIDTRFIVFNLED